MKLTLNDVCLAIVDCEHKTAPTQPEGHPSIRTPNIGRGRLILEGVNRVSDETYLQWTQRMEPSAGDLILAREAPIGNVAIVPNGLKVCLGQRTVLIRADRTKVLPEYLVYLMLGDEIQGRIHSQSNGATVRHLNMKDIRGLALPRLPSMADQRRISSILSAYDDLIENNTRRIAILEDMARRIYEEWFVRFRFPGHDSVRMVESELGLVPEGWQVRLFGDEIELAYGKALKAEDRSHGEVPVYGSSGVIGLHSESFVGGPGIIVGRKGNVGSVYWCDVPFFPIDTVFYVNTALPLNYVFFNLQRQNFLNNDAAVPGLNRNQAYALPLLVPYKDVLGRFEAESAQLLGLARLLARKNLNLRATRDLLLPKLISGELDVSEMPEPQALAA